MSWSKWVTGGLAVAVVGALVCTHVLSQEKKDAPSSGDHARQPNMDEMMAKMKEMSAPGPMHKNLEKLVGQWAATCKCWMDPAAAPMESKGKVEYTSILGGRFVQSRFRGEMMGEPFEGMGLDGYDNFKKKYVCTWIDSMGTAICTFTGTPDETGQVITYTGQIDDCMSGRKDVPVRIVIRWSNDDKYTFTWYQPGPDGKETKSMEIEYNRVK